MPPPRCEKKRSCWNKSVRYRSTIFRPSKLGHGRVMDKRRPGSMQPQWMFPRWREHKRANVGLRGRGTRVAARFFVRSGAHEARGDAPFRRRVQPENTEEDVSLGIMVGDKY